MHGVVNEKTDVFAFGVLLLELITGRLAVDSCRQSLVIWVRQRGPAVVKPGKTNLVLTSIRVYVETGKAAAGCR